MNRVTVVFEYRNEKLEEIYSSSSETQAKIYTAYYGDGSWGNSVKKPIFKSPNNLDFPQLIIDMISLGFFYAGESVSEKHESTNTGYVSTNIRYIVFYGEE